ncbi:TadG family pilus assembly protein [Stappia stellulata]|uniref:TadG family pilus assembly protein n=1 Tax=Stappia stellulata TaxID=71235 RepID=UPI00042709EA|nr:TadG family pilus assembly protein [Stappia stellulata]
MFGHTCGTSGCWQRGRGLVRRLISNRHGSVSIMAGLAFVLMAAVAALAIDIASLYLERRHLQGASDLAAIAGAADIDNAEVAVARALAANGLTATADVTRGRYVADDAVHHTQRFTPGARPYNAVQVLAKMPGNIFFARVFDVQAPQISVKATAATAELAGFTVGSRLLALREGVANALLGALLGTTVSLSVMDYEALADVDLDVVDLLSQVNASADLELGTYEELLAADVSLADFLEAAAAAAGNAREPTAAFALRRLSGTARAGLSVPLSAVFDAGPYGDLAIGERAPGIGLRASAMQLVSLAGLLANGERQVSLDLAAEVPGLVDLRLDLVIGEPPQDSAFMRVGEAGSTVATAQTRLRLVAQVGGRGLLKTVQVRLPVYLDVAYAQARLSGISCRGGRVSRVRVEARPGIADLWLGEVRTGDITDFERKPDVDPARIVSTALISATGKAHVEAGSQHGTLLTFSRRDIETRTVKRVSSSGILQSVVSSLVEDLDLRVRVVLLTLPLGGVTDLLGEILADLARPLDAVVESLLMTLGVSLGEADVSVQDVRCNGSMLAG